jgi:hypothetical protein
MTTTTTLAVDAFSEGVQTGLRVPAILLGLVGVVLAIVAGRRLGVLAAIFGAIGSGLLALDQVSGLVWVMTLRAMVEERDARPDDIAAASNLCTVIDVLLTTIGLAFLVFAFFVRRPADRKALPGYVSGDFATPGFPSAGYQQPAPAFGPPPPPYGPPPSYPGSPSGYPGGPPNP